MPASTCRPRHGQAPAAALLQPCDISADRLVDGVQSAGDIGPIVGRFGRHQVKGLPQCLKTRGDVVEVSERVAVLDGGEPIIHVIGEHSVRQNDPAISR